MGSLNNGLPITQSTNIRGHYHRGNALVEFNSTTDTQSVISNSGVDDRSNYAQPFGVSLEYDHDGRTFLSGLPLSSRELQFNSAATGILFLDKGKFANSSGNFQHVVTRAIGGTHVSVTDRQAVGSSAPMESISERKVFFISSDREKTSNFADWTIFNSSGVPVGAAAGITDTDVTPNATFDA